MAFTINAVGQVHPSGNDAYGAFYDSSIAGAGIDYSQQLTPAWTANDVVTNGTTTVTSATGGFANTHIGNAINIAGTSYTIVARNNANTILIDGAAPSGSGQLGNIGGAAASVGFMGKLAAISGRSTSNGFKCWVKYGTYSLSGTANVNGGIVNLAASPIQFEGYDLVLGDRARKPIFNATAGSLTMFASGTGTANNQFANMKVDANGQSSVVGFNVQSRNNCYDLEAWNCSTGFSNRVTSSYADNCNVGYATSTQYCVANNCGSGFLNNQHVGAIAVGCSTGFQGQSGGNLALSNCVIANASNNSISATNCGTAILNSIIIGRGSSDNNRNAYVNRLALYNATTPYLSGLINLTADPFVNSGATIASWADAFAAFALNSASGGGALCRGAGWPGAIDLGAVQHQDSGSGGGTTLASFFDSPFIFVGGRTI